MSSILLWAWTPNELLSRSYNSHHHLFSFLQEGRKKANQPQTTTTTGPGGCPHGLMDTRPPPPGRQTTGEEYQRRLPALQVSLFANFLMCPPTCLRGITSCLPPHPQPHNFPRRPACVRPKPDSGRGPGAGGGGVPGAPALGVGHTGGRGLFTRRPSPPSAARTPPARPGPAPLTSVHQFEALGFPAPLPLRELHGAAGGQGRGCGRGRPGGGTEGAAAEAAAAALALVTRQRERGDQGPSLGSAGGRHKQGKNHSSPPGGCGRRGRAGGALPGEVVFSTLSSLSLAQDRNSGNQNTWRNDCMFSSVQWLSRV